MLEEIMIIFILLIDLLFIICSLIIAKRSDDIMKYKVIREYERFYLCESENGYRKCLDKYKYKPDIDGYIIEKSQYDYHGSIPRNVWLKERK